MVSCIYIWTQQEGNVRVTRKPQNLDHIGLEMPSLRVPTLIRQGNYGIWDTLSQMCGPWIGYEQILLMNDVKLLNERRFSIKSLMLELRLIHSFMGKVEWISRDTINNSFCITSHFHISVSYNKSSNNDYICDDICRSYTSPASQC